MWSEEMQRVQLLASVALVAAVAACAPTVNVITPGTTGSPKPTASTGTTGTGTGTTTNSPAPTASASTSVGGTVGGTIVTAGNDFAAAANVTAGATVTTKSGADDQFFKITVPAGKDGVLKVTLTETDGNYTPGIRFYDSGKTDKGIQYATDGSTNPFVAQFPATGGATYYWSLNAKDATSADLVQKVEFIPVDDMSEPNDDFATATALPLGTAKDFFIFAGVDTGTESKGEDLDFFKVDFPAGKTKLHVKITNNSSTKSTADVDGPQNFQYTIYDSDKTELNTRFGANDNANFDFSDDIAAAGTYYIKVKAQGAGNSTKASQILATAE
jgi:hypothetical protein